MRAAAVVLAAGRGVRIGGSVPKQYLELDGKSVLRRSVEAFLSHPGIDAVQPVIAAEDGPRYRRAIESLDTQGLLDPVGGGANRQASSLAGLLALKAKRPRYVLIHDAARPFVGAEVISRVLDRLTGQEGAIPVVRIPDGVWSVDGQDVCREPLDRDAMRRVQTPQGFPFEAILAAHETFAGESHFDDASVAARARIRVSCVEGDPANRKLTIPEDVAAAVEASRPAPDTRVGQGVDVHAFGSGRGARLCAVDIPDCPSLEGHSDADVGLHALADAIYGAIGEGDIGEHFPPADPRWEDCDSRVFLADAVVRAARAGFEVSNADVTLICETPRVSPYRQRMKEAVAACLGVPADRASVKATTTERLGFAGRGEGIVAMALVTLRARA